MKTILILLLILSSLNRLEAQTPDPINCISQPSYTKTTDPNDNTQYVFTQNSFNYNNNPNAVGSKIHFDWVTSKYFSVCTVNGLNAPDQILKSPFYCSGNGPMSGGCLDNNLRIYNNISSNFTNYSTDVARLKEMDVLPEDGWELLKYSFGRPIDIQTPSDNGSGILSPYIWLYNRYTGKSKFFIAITSYQGSFTDISSITIQFTVNGDYDIMANATPFTHILSDFDHSTTANAAMNCDIQQIGSGSPYTYYWLYAEFTTSYDPCVCRQLKPDAQLDFQVIKTSVSQLNLELDGMATPTPVYNSVGSLNADGKSVNSGSTDNSSTALINGAKAVIKGYKDWKEYAETYKGYFNQLTNNGNTVPTNNQQALNIITSFAQSLGQGGANTAIQTKIFYDFANGANTTGQNPNPDPINGPSRFIQKLSGLSPLVEDLASAAPYVGAFLALTNFLTDAGSNESQSQPVTQPAAPPTSYLLNAKILGTLTSVKNIVNGGIYLPGVKTNNNFNQIKNEDYPYPIYNNALGVFNVIDVPDFEYKTIPMTNYGVDPADPNMPYLSGSSFATAHAVPNYSQVRKPFEDVYDYKLSGSIKYALNPAANLTVKSIDAAYVIEYDGPDPLELKHNGKIFYNSDLSGTTLSNKQIPYYPSSGFDYTEYSPYSGTTNTNYSLNDIINKLNAEGFEIEYQSQPTSTSPGYTNPLDNGSNSTDEKFRIRTKYVPLQNLQNIDFLLIGSLNNKPNIYLKLFCKFSKNNKPTDEPVTFVMTYDITNKLKAAKSTGSGGGGSYYYYFAKDKSYPNAALNKPADYAHFGGLKVYGAYYSPNYGTPGPVTISNPISGALSTGNINISNNVNLLPNGSSSFLTYTAVTDLNIGDNVEIATGSGSQQIVSVRAGNNINIGKGFYTNTFGSNNSVTYYAGNDINIGDSYVIGTYNYYNLNMYAGNNIKLSHTSNYNNLYSAVHLAYIINSNLYAKNEIDINVSVLSSEVSILGESVLSTNQNIPNAWAVLHNDDGSIPISSLQADNNTIASKCSITNNRLMANPPLKKINNSNSP